MGVWKMPKKVKAGAKPKSEKQVKIVEQVSLYTRTSRKRPVLTEQDRKSVV